MLKLAVEENDMASKIFTPEELARQGKARLKAKADPIRAAGARKYFKETVEFYGVASPDVRSIAADLYAVIKKDWTVDDAVRYCDIMFREAELEAKGLGALVMIRYKKVLPKTLFERIKGWLAADLLNNWASVDVFCPEAVGTLLVRYPELVEKIKSWAGHPNLWVRRASIVSFLKLAKDEIYFDTIYGIAKAHFATQDDLIEKACGWLLREVGKKDMARLERFLLEHGPSIPRTTLRYAIERFDAKKRAGLLLKTRG
jgi:3-methyladenine DNA glycosylase AlkD